MRAGNYGGFEIWKPGVTIIGSKTGSNEMPLIQGAPVDYVSGDGSTKQAAVYITQDNATVMGFSISGDSGYDTAVAVDYNVTGTHLHFNNLFTTKQGALPSTMTGLDNMGSSLVDARMNWWGDETGPGSDQQTLFDDCLSLTFDAGQGALLSGNSCFKTSLFKPFLGSVGVEILGTTAVPIEALGPLNATASADAEAKVVFSSFGQSPIDETVSDDPYVYSVNDVLGRNS